MKLSNNTFNPDPTTISMGIVLYFYNLIKEKEELVGMGENPITILSSAKIKPAKFFNY